MARKTNKTAHVLNLLASGTSKSGESEQMAEPAQAKQPGKSSSVPNISIIDKPTGAADPLAGLIKDSLNKEISMLSPETSEDTLTEAIPGDTEFTPAAPVMSEMESVPSIPEPVAPVMAEAEAVPSILQPAAPMMAEAPSIPSIPVPVAPVMAETETAPSIPQPAAPMMAEAPSIPSIPEPVAPVMTEAPSIPSIPEPVAPVMTETETAPSILQPAAPMASEAPSIPSIPEPVAPVMTQIEAEPVPTAMASFPASVPAPVHTTASVYVPDPVPEPATAPEPDPDPVIESSYNYINMMELLLDERHLEFMHRFDTCTCERCTLDIKALALSNLPSKYLVMPKASLAPLTSYYRNKYNILVVTELTKACLAIINDPRH